MSEVNFPFEKNGQLWEKSKILALSQLRTSPSNVPSDETVISTPSRSLAHRPAGTKIPK